MKTQKPSEAPDEPKAEPPDPEHLARFRRVMTALVAVPKDEAFRVK